MTSKEKLPLSMRSQTTLVFRESLVVMMTLWLMVLMSWVARMMTPTVEMM
jgi:hypothetical protein